MRFQLLRGGCLGSGGASPHDIRQPGDLIHIVNQLLAQIHQLRNRSHDHVDRQPDNSVFRAGAAERRKRRNRDHHPRVARLVERGLDSLCQFASAARIEPAHHNRVGQLMDAVGKLVYLFQLVGNNEKLWDWDQRIRLQRRIGRARRREKPVNRQVRLAIVKKLGEALGQPHHAVFRLAPNLENGGFLVNLPAGRTNADIVAVLLHGAIRGAVCLIPAKPLAHFCAAQPCGARHPINIAPLAGGIVQEVAPVQELDNHAFRRSGNRAALAFLAAGLVVVSQPRHATRIAAHAVTHCQHDRVDICQVKRGRTDAFQQLRRSTAHGAAILKARHNDRHRWARVNRRVHRLQVRPKQLHLAITAAIGQALKVRVFPVYLVGFFLIEPEILARMFDALKPFRGVGLACIRVFGHSAALHLDAAPYHTPPPRIKCGPSSPWSASCRGAAAGGSCPAAGPDQRA